MSNFTFLNTDWPELFETACEAEQNVNSAPRTSCFYARRSLERAVKWLYTNDSYLKQPYADNLAALIHEPTFRENLEPCLFPKILTIQKIGNLAVHSDKPISNSDSGERNRKTPDDHDYSEAETRDYFIDLLLKESGWDLRAPDVLEYPVQGMPGSTCSPTNRLRSANGKKGVITAEDVGKSNEST